MVGSPYSKVIFNFMTDASPFYVEPEEAAKEQMGKTHRS